MHFTIFVRHIRRFWPVFNKKSWPIMRPSALQRWLRWFISAMPTMHCTHVVQVKTCGWGWTTWLPSIWLRSDSSLMKYLFRRILLLYSELSPVKYIQNKRALTALYRSQQCTNKGLFYPWADEKGIKNATRLKQYLTSGKAKDEFTQQESTPMQNSFAVRILQYL